jgi:hypothetical protein
MGLVLRPMLKQEIIQHCGHCRQPLDNHDPECPVGRYKALKAQQKLCRCPECDGFVEVNSHDYFECHNCHTQFSRAQRDVTATRKKSYLDFPGESDLIDVVILEEKGDSKFPISERMMELEKILNAPKKLRRRN